MTSVSVLRRRDSERTIMATAARQHGIVSREQLIAAGIQPHFVGRSVGANRLRPIRRGIYVVGPLVVARALPMSAVLSCGKSAVVSHCSAASVMEFMERPADSGAVDITIPPASRRIRPGIRIHRIALESDEVMLYDGIPITTAARTLYDLATSISGRDLERAVAETLSRRLTSHAKIDALVKRYEHRPASRRLRAVLGTGKQPGLSRSVAEESFLALVGKGQLPRPEMNVDVHGCEVDFYWPGAQLVVEVDGFAFHVSRRSFESDRRRDAVLAAAGMRVMRVTWRQLEDEREAVLVRLSKALFRRDVSDATDD